ncbi:hypothetical protein NL676_021022 [Syzygium grande]|nr:hypothetical protein NL676_021022 [Syzygium grande]
MRVVTGGGGGGSSSNGKVKAWDSSESMGRKKKKSSDGGERKSVYFSSALHEVLPKVVDREEDRIEIVFKAERVERRLMHGGMIPIEQVEFSSIHFGFVLDVGIKITRLKMSNLNVEFSWSLSKVSHCIQTLGKAEYLLVIFLEGRYSLDLLIYVLE